jgi:CBS-domain-containing membrane protein
MQHRSRYSLKGELALAILPTLTIILVMLLVESFARQRLLFASLASSAFLIYHDPRNRMNSFYSLVVAQMGGATIGFLSSTVLGEGYWAAVTALFLTIIFIVSLDAMHPPAIATGLSFAFRTPGTQAFSLFLLAVGMVVVLAVLEQTLLWLARRVEKINKIQDLA